MTESYPLQWPIGKPRTSFPARSKFADRSIDAATKILQHQIQLLKASNMILSTNLRLRNDGLPYSSQAQPKDQGAAVYFFYKKQTMCFACDRWDRIQDNIYAVAMTIEALRGIERWGSGDMVQQAFAGFAALPAPNSNHKKPWWEVLECALTSSAEAVERNYKHLSRKFHPDRPDGDHDKFIEVGQAYDEFKKLWLMP